MANVEDQIQSHLIIWIKKRERDLLHNVFHVPNGGSRNKIEAAKFKRMGVKAGVPDLVFILPNGKTLWLELKKTKGKLSKVQIDCIDILKDRGHIVLVGYGFTDAQDKLIAFENEWYKKESNHE